jgi:hypothetical protein
MDPGAFGCPPAQGQRIPRQGEREDRMRAALVRLGVFGTGFALALTVAGQTLFAAGDIVVPEIDPGSITTALGVLGAGVLMLTARRRSR